jgi:hypothetical protein
MGIRPGFLALLWAAATAGLLLLVATQPQRAWSPPPHTTVVLGGEHYRLDAVGMAWLQEISRLHFSEGAEGARALMAGELAAGLDEAFAGVRARLPTFADWYYSLGGEYSRLGMAALARLDLADGEYVARRATEMLFPAEDWERALAKLDLRMVSALHAHQQGQRHDWLADVGARLAPHRVPAPLDPGDRLASGELLILDGLIAELVSAEQEALRGRVRMSTVAGGSTAAGVLMWRAAAARAATASGRAAAARGAGRTAARAGTAAGGGLAACAPGGPMAAGCAVLAFAATWVATDWALLKLDEVMRRDDLLAALEAGLAQLEAKMQEDALVALDAVVREQEARAAEAVTRSFTPARAGQRPWAGAY